MPVEQKRWSGWECECEWSALKPFSNRFARIVWVCFYLCFSRGALLSSISRLAAWHNAHHTRTAIAQFNENICFPSYAHSHPHSFHSSHLFALPRFVFFLLFLMWCGVVYTYTLLSICHNLLLLPCQTLIGFVFLWRCFCSCDDEIKFVCEFGLMLTFFLFSAAPPIINSLDIE